MYDTNDIHRETAEFAITLRWNDARGDYESLTRLYMLIHGMSLMTDGELHDDLTLLKQIVDAYADEAPCAPRIRLSV